MNPENAWKALENGDLQGAEDIWNSLLSKASTQEETDSANWGLGYVLVAQKRFSEAESIWSEIFKRTGDHKALHQIGMVKRDSGELGDALSVFAQEHALISEDDVLSKSVNLYELCYVNHLLGNAAQALSFFHEYESIAGQSGDLIEEACFYRLKGDIFFASERSTAKLAFENARARFYKANDIVGLKEITERLMSLDSEATN